MVLIVHLKANALSMPCGQRIQFRRRWEASLFALMAIESQPVHAHQLEHVLAQLGQAQPLNRSQIARLIKSLQAGLDSAPAHRIVLDYAPRSSTVGPWRVRGLELIKVDIEHAGASAALFEAPHPGPADAWRWPSLLATPDLEQLRYLLSQCLVSDSFAIDGNYHSALDTLDATERFALAPEARAMFALRRAQFLARIGSYPAARQALHLVLEATAGLRDPSLAGQALFLLDRIAYDESPGEAQAQLWQRSNVHVPEQLGGAPVLPDWHNLRALLCRRRLQALAAGAHVPSGPVDLPELHQLALQHLESAIYGALRSHNWERLQAFVANLAFHLQTVIPYGLAQVREVFNWHTLSMNYEEKLDAGKDLAWTDIFLGEFWLDHAHECDQYTQDFKAHGLDGPAFGLISPSNPDFYTRAIERTALCADLRQHSIAWIMFARFHTLRGNSAQVQRAHLALRSHLASAPELGQRLQADGYARWLPAI